MSVELPADPRAPAFFLSYARARQSDDLVGAPMQVNDLEMHFFHRLTANVNELIVRPTGCDLGFMDMTLDGGERWRRSVLGAAASCQVFVCLLSARYLTRSWCAMEWDLFSRRKVARRDGEPTDETGIIPVLWAPLGDEVVPPEVNEVNRFRPADMPDKQFLPWYEQHGLYGLLKMSQHDAFETIVWMLALRVQRLYHSHWVEPVDHTTITDLRQSFTADGPA